MRALKLCIVLALLSLSSSAAAQDKKSCLAAVDDGQNLREQGQLAAARAQFQLCSSKACSPAVSKQCTDWYAEVERDQPSALFRAKDPSGKELLDVRVIVDDTAIAESIPSQPYPLDPREHSVRFEQRNGVTVDGKILLRVGEKSKMIELTFAPPPGPPPSPPPPKPVDQKLHVPLLGWVGGGIFVAGAATTVVFAILANGAESDLRSSCAPHCAKSDRDAIKTKLLFANIGMGVGIGGLVLAGVTTFMANRGTAQNPEKTANSGIRFVATPDGIAGTF